MKNKEKVRIIVTGSTFPRWESDNVSNFVEKQVEALSKFYPQLEIHVLVPHHVGALKNEKSQDTRYIVFSIFGLVNCRS